MPLRSRPTDEAEHLHDVRHDVIDDVFGRVTITVDAGGGLVTVQGESLPEVTVERRSGVPVLGYIPTVGYALAASFGTGARFFLFALFAGLGENAPW